jgi:RNA polymerase sigma factor (TIGR02999 family)
MATRTTSEAAGAAALPPEPALDRLRMDRLFSATYEELRRLASSVRRDEPSATLNPTALVNEAWLKLAGSPEIATESRLHFKRIAARAMRQVLVEAARRRHAHKRGGPDAAFVTFDDALDGRVVGATDAEALLALDAALDALAQLNPRQARMIESRFFGGLDVAETAELLGVSEATVMRDWRAARAWLAMELRRTS